MGGIPPGRPTSYIHLARWKACRAGVTRRSIPGLHWPGFLVRRTARSRFCFNHLGFSYLDLSDWDFWSFKRMPKAHPWGSGRWVCRRVGFQQAAQEKQPVIGVHVRLASGRSRQTSHRTEQTFEATTAFLMFLRLALSTGRSIFIQRLLFWGENYSIGEALQCYNYRVGNVHQHTSIPSREVVLEAYKIWRTAIRLFPSNQNSVIYTVSHPTPRLSSAYETSELKCGHPWMVGRCPQTMYCMAFRYLTSPLDLPLRSELEQASTIILSRARSAYHYTKCRPWYPPYWSKSLPYSPCLSKPLWVKGTASFFPIVHLCSKHWHMWCQTISNSWSRNISQPSHGQNYLAQVASASLARTTSGVCRRSRDWAWSPGARQYSAWAWNKSLRRKSSDASWTGRWCSKRWK
jgi:hypothetical protein